MKLIYRSRAWNRQIREMMKYSKRENWFKKGGAEAVVFIPNTPGSILKKRYMEEVGKSGLRVKMVEGSGKPIKFMLQRSDPFKASNCPKRMSVLFVVRVMADVG